MAIGSSLITLMNGNGNTGISIILQKRIQKDSILYLSYKCSDT